MDTEVVKTKDLETAVDGALDLMGQQQEQLCRAELENQRLRAELAMAEEALKGILASLTQPATFPADIEYARSIARAFLNREGR